MWRVWLVGLQTVIFCNTVKICVMVKQFKLFHTITYTYNVFFYLWFVPNRSCNYEEVAAVKWPRWLHFWSQRLPESQHVHSRHRRRTSSEFLSTCHSESLKELSGNFRKSSLLQLAVTTESVTVRESRVRHIAQLHIRRPEFELTFW